MSLPVMLDVAAAAIAGQYRVLLDAVAGQFARVLDSHDPTTPKARSDFRAAISRDMTAFLSGMVLSLDARTNEIKNVAVVASGVSLSVPDQESLSEYVGETLDALHETMQAILARDQVTTDRTLRKVALQVELLQAGTGISKVGALIKVKFGKVRKLAFAQEDRIGRKRASEDFVRVLVRQHLLLTYVESYLFALAKSGKDLARVVYTDERNGLVFSITGTTGGYPSYDDIRESAFHPNSLASVEGL